MTAHTTVTAPPAAHSIAPTRAAERIQTIDALRGFALLGILLVNAAFFSHSYFDAILGGQPATGLDRWAQLFVQFFAEGKFYSMFAFLFGMGMAIVQERCAARGVPFVPLYTRRLLALLGFGLIHAYLFWFGDILILYSVIGFLTLWLFRDTPPRRLAEMALIFLLIAVLADALSYGAAAAGRLAVGDAKFDAGFAAQMDSYRAQDAAADLAYGAGSYLDTVRERVHTMNLILATFPLTIFNVWAMFALGYAAGKWRLHARLAEEQALLRRVLLWGGVVGLVGSLIFVVGMNASSPASMSALSWLANTAKTIGAPALSMAYMAGIALLLLRPAWQRRLRPLAAAGRMTLTNYLAQTLIMTTLMYAYGFGLYGMGMAGGVALAFVIWLVEIGWSMLWFRAFRYGPMEWIWRSITYWQPQPFLRREG